MQTASFAKFWRKWLLCHRTVTKQTTSGENTQTWSCVRPNERIGELRTVIRLQLVQNRIARCKELRESTFSVSLKGNATVIYLLNVDDYFRSSNCAGRERKGRNICNCKRSRFAGGRSLTPSRMRLSTSRHVMTCDKGYQNIITKTQSCQENSRSCTALPKWPVNYAASIAIDA